MILRFQKIVLHNKVINKNRSTKNQEDSTHRFGYNYLTNQAKLLHDGIIHRGVGTPRVCTGYHFFKKKSLLRAF